MTKSNCFASVSKNQSLVIFSLIFAYLAVLLGGALAVSARFLFWHDELFTYYIATLPSFSQVWSALSTGQEQIPPGYYAIVRGSLGIFGDNSIALRLPSLIGFLLMAVALFEFVSLRLSPIYGAIAALFPMVTSVRYYVHDARPYGLELGFAALALLCWQRATEGRNRFIALSGLCISLAGAISCHYYGVLLILPLAIGEVVRTVARRRIDVAILACFAASLLPLFIVLQLILIALKLVGVFWAQPHWDDVERFYIHLLAPSSPALVAALSIAIMMSGSLRFGRGKEQPTAEPKFPNREIAAILGFVAMPLFGVLLGKLVTNAFVDRYVLSAVLGISILFAQATYKLFRGQFRLALGFALLLLVYVVALDLREIRTADNERAGFEESMSLLRSTNPDNLPIVIGNQLTFTVFSHYAPSDVRSRLVYPASQSLAGQLLGIDSVENGMVQLVGPWFHMNVVPLEAFLASKPRFLLYGAGPFNWINRALSDRGFRFEYLARGPYDRYLFSVAPPLR
jgi:hypothetical protein